MFYLPETKGLSSKYKSIVWCFMLTSRHAYTGRTNFTQLQVYDIAGLRMQWP